MIKIDVVTAVNFNFACKDTKKNILAGNIMGFCCLKMFILPLIALFCLVYFASGVIHKDLFA